MYRVFRDGEDMVVVKDKNAWRGGNRFSLDGLFRSDSAQEYIEEFRGEVCDLPDTGRAWSAPVENQEVWAAGVTYYRSREARMEESEEAGGDVFYSMVYDAERPELFFKSLGPKARGHKQSVRIREDSEWDVPEPELTLAINTAGRIFGYTIGNDMSSRSIEGENPLYLPQAKVYRGSCAVGPALVVCDPLPRETRIEISIERGGKGVFGGSTDLSQIKRGFDELAGFLFRENEFPNGALLMTGTGAVPGTDFTLQSGDLIKISIDGLGILENLVE